MNTTYRVINWEFNRELWAQTIRRAIEEIGMREFSEIIEVDNSTLSNWAHMPERLGHKWPQMQNFMKVINALDLDPSEFFILEE